MARFSLALVAAVVLVTADCAHLRQTREDLVAVAIDALAAVHPDDRRLVTGDLCPCPSPSPSASATRSKSRSAPVSRSPTRSRSRTSSKSRSASTTTTPSRSRAVTGDGGVIPGAPLCPLFPANNPWNQRIDTLPVASNSATMISSIGTTVNLHPDFGAGLWDGGPIGIPFNIVDSGTPRVSAGTGDFDYYDESDLGEYPMPANPVFEYASDRHVLMVDSDSCMLYELFNAAIDADGTWHAGSGAKFDLRSNALRPAGYTSADAAGLPILPGLAVYEQVAAGRINHALRFTAQRTRRAYEWPARHYASSDTSASRPPMGLRVRLKASFNIATFPPQSRVILQALKEFGMILADNGSNWFISGAPNPGWNDDDLAALKSVPGSAFEVVNTSSMEGWEPGVYA